MVFEEQPAARCERLQKMGMQTSIHESNAADYVEALSVRKLTVKVCLFIDNVQAFVVVNLPGLFYSDVGNILANYLAASPGKKPGVAPETACDIQSGGAFGYAEALEPGFEKRAGPGSGSVTAFSVTPVPATAICIGH